MGVPRENVNIKRFGFISIELTIKEASRCCGTPFLPKEAISGTVPYIHMGDAAPNKAAGIIARTENLLKRCLPASAVILEDRKTEIKDPATVPAIQYKNIILN